MNTAPSFEVINKVLAGLGTADEAKHVSNWFATTEGQQFLEKQMDKDYEWIDQNSDSLTELYDIPSDKIYKQIDARLKFKNRRMWLFRVAALFIPFILITFLILKLNSQVDLLGGAEYVELVVPNGETLRMAFQDGSIVHINSNSKLKYPQKFGLNSRTIFFEGEAYFTVSSNSKRPFIINLEKSSVEVIGTSFNIKAYPEEENIHISLDEGKVSFTSLSKNVSEMTPGDYLVFNKKNGLCNISRNEKEVENSSWDRKPLIFKDTSIQEVLTVLGRMFKVTFKINNPIILNYKFTLTTDDLQLHQILYDLEQVAPIQFTVLRDQITIDLIKE